MIPNTIPTAKFAIQNTSSALTICNSAIHLIAQMTKTANVLTSPEIKAKYPSGNSSVSAKRLVSIKPFRVWMNAQITQTIKSQIKRGEIVVWKFEWGHSIYCVSMLLGLP